MTASPVLALDRQALLARETAIDYLTARRGLDEAQANAIWDRLVEQAWTPGPGAADDATAAFRDECSRRAQSLADRGLYRWVDAYRSLAASPPGDPAVAQALRGVPKAGHKAEEHLAAQVAHVAGLVGVAPAVAEERIVALRAQYASDFAALPDDRRPAPPESWIRGFTSKGQTSKGCPSDPATLYAFYRAQADDHVFTAAERADATYASTDLETASPDGPSGFQPRQGHIIEVGIVVHDDTGAEVTRYEQMISPPQSALDEFGTGRVDIHQITVADLVGKPGWAECAADVRAALGNHILLAQGARFERSWLGHHLPVAGHEWDRDCVGVDTLTIAQQHYPDLERHRLGYICEALGVPYTNGHRAMHDAEAAARAFFAMRSAIRAAYAADPKFADLPLPGRKVSA